MTSVVMPIRDPMDDSSHLTLTNEIKTNLSDHSKAFIEPGGLYGAPRHSMTTNPTNTPNQKGWQPNAPYNHSVPGRGDHWSFCHQLVQKHDMEICNVWAEEVDKLLIFAGLFSAAVTAFIIESYRWLQPDNTTDRLLDQIYRQLNGTTFLEGPSVSPLTNGVPGLQSSAVRINVCWFLSLTLSLATVLVGILCLQWLREYRREAAIPLPDSISLRHMRYEGLVGWYVPSILSTLPLVLQVALVLFFIGVLDLLWSLDHRVAIPVTVAVALLFIFVIATTILPALQLLYTWGRGLNKSQCAYKSPQSWIFYRLILTCIWCLRPFVQSVWRGSKRTYASLFSLPSCHGWNDYDSMWQTVRHGTSRGHKQSSDDLSKGLLWIIRNFNQKAETVHAMHHCLYDVPVSTAVRVVGGLDPQIEDRLSAMLKPPILLTPYIVEQQSLQPHNHVQQDLIMAYFHEEQCQIHSESRIYQLEHIVRFMNSSEHRRGPGPYLEWPVQDINAYPEDLAREFLRCLIAKFRNSNISRSTFTRSEIQEVWKIIQGLSKSFETRDRPAGATKVVLISTLIQQLDQWLKQPSTHITLNRVERVRICVQGLINIFFPWPSMTMNRLMSFHQDISVVHDMMHSVNTLLLDLDYAGTTDGTVLDPSHQEAWLSLNRQLKPTLESEAES